MANSISMWYSTIQQWSQFSTKSLRINYPGLKKLRSERAGIKAPDGAVLLSPGDEIINQMSKEYPTLFMT
jgi:hypothetical protein